MWAIVPIKTLDRAKQRLANVLSEEERRSLMLAMARDVLTCLATSSQLTGILIVSRTAEADALAQSFSTERFAESPDANLPEALEQATAHLISNFDAKGVMVVPADVPGIRTDHAGHREYRYQRADLLAADVHSVHFRRQKFPAPCRRGIRLRHHAHHRAGHAFRAGYRYPRGSGGTAQAGTRQPDGHLPGKGGHRRTCRTAFKLPIRIIS